MRFFLEKIFIVIFGAALFCGCEVDVEENEEQQEDMIYYLESEHTPLLIAESALGSALDNDPPFYSVYTGFAYRYISTFYDTGREAMSEVQKGSTIEIYFDLFQFEFTDITSSDLALYTNKSDEITKLKEANSSFNELLWSTDPLEIKIGDSSTLSSIHDALIGCREGDEVFIYMTRNAAYSDEIIGLAEKGSALRFSCTIESVY